MNIEKIANFIKEQEKNRFGYEYVIGKANEWTGTVGKGGWAFSYYNPKTKFWYEPTKTYPTRKKAIEEAKNLGGDYFDGDA